MSAPAAPRLMVITSGAGSPGWRERLSQLLMLAKPGSVAVQLRAPELSVSARLALARELREETARTGQRLIINDRLDVALLAGADGLHLPEAGLPIEAVRARCPALWLSAARHSLSTPEGAVPDAWVLSPVVSPRKGRPALGLTKLSAAQEQLGAPIYALGGITATSAAACLAHGAWGVAVMGAVMEPGEDLPALLAALSILAA